MIKELAKHNLFETEAQTLVCPVNTYGVMGAGLAKAFAMKDPAILAPYQKLCDEAAFYYRPLYSYPFLLQQRVLYFPTKYYWKQNSSLTLVESGLQYLASHYEQLGIESLALPKIGCGLGHLDWEIVKALIHTHLQHAPFTIYLVT